MPEDKKPTPKTPSESAANVRAFATEFVETIKRFTGRGTKKSKDKKPEKPKK